MPVARGAVTKNLKNPVLKELKKHQLAWKSRAHVVSAGLCGESVENSHKYFAAPTKYQ